MGMLLRGSSGKMHSFGERLDTHYTYSKWFYTPHYIFSKTE